MTTTQNTGWFNNNKWLILVLVAVLGGVTITTKNCTFDGSKVSLDTTSTKIDTVIGENGDTIIIDSIK